MKKQPEKTSEQVIVTATDRAGWNQNEKISQPDRKTRLDSGKLVWNGSPLSKKLLMRLIERVQES